jgi:hypothetical protein
MDRGRCIQARATPGFPHIPGAGHPTTTVPGLFVMAWVGDGSLADHGWGLEIRPLFSTGCMAPQAGLVPGQYYRRDPSQVIQACLR